MEGGERFSHHPVRTRPADSSIKIVVQPSRFGQVQLSPLQEETKEQLFQGLVTRCCKLLCLLCESPASSRNLPQKLNHAAFFFFFLNFFLRNLCIKAKDA